MDLDELQSVRDRERQTDKLQQLRESFYADAGEFIQQLRDQRERAAERADDPFDAPEVNRLSDEIDTAEQTVEAIYEKRVGKIVKAASFAAADLPAESDGMTAEEQDLFETLVDDIKENRRHVMDVLAGEADDTGEASGGESGTDAADAAPEDHVPDAVEQAGESDPSPPAEVPPEPGAAEPSPPDASSSDDVSAADAMGGATDTQPGETGAGTADSPSPPPDADHATPPENATAERPDESANAETSETEPELRNDGGTGPAAGGVDRETVRITADVGDIFGVDEREYDLAENDVVQLPTANAEPLVERDAAERLD